MPAAVHPRMGQGLARHSVTARSPRVIRSTTSARLDGWVSPSGNRSRHRDARTSTIPIIDRTTGLMTHSGRVDHREAQRRKEPRDRPRPVGVRAIWKSLGPGIITGAADDDPSGIATYSVAGAQYGPALLWTALFTWPLMVAVQTMCARIGMVTGRGIAGALRHKFPRPVLLVAAVALFIANTINLGADLTGMADASELLTGVNSHVWVVVLGVGIAVATIRLRYATLARV